MDESWNILCFQWMFCFVVLRNHLENFLLKIKVKFCQGQKTGYSSEKDRIVDSRYA